MQLLGNSWAIQCNVVGTSRVLMQFYEKGIQSRTWGNVATSCEMWESELSFFFCRASPISTLRLPRLHMLVFLLMLPLIAKHPHLISFVFHSFWVESISCLHVISLRFLLFFVHLIKSCPFPPQITSSGLSRQQAGGDARGRSRAEPLMCYQWQVSSHETRGLSVSTFCFVFLYLLNFY